PSTRSTPTAYVTVPPCFTVWVAGVAVRLKPATSNWSCTVRTIVPLVPRTSTVYGPGVVAALVLTVIETSPGRPTEPVSKLNVGGVPPGGPETTAAVTPMLALNETEG